MSKSDGCPVAALGFISGMRRTTSRPVIRSAFFREENAVNGTSATSAADIQAWASSSYTALVYLIGVHASASMAVMARFTAASMRTVTETSAPPARAALTAGYP